MAEETKPPVSLLAQRGSSRAPPPIPMPMTVTMPTSSLSTSSSSARFSLQATPVPGNNAGITSPTSMVEEKQEENPTEKTTSGPATRNSKGLSGFFSRNSLRSSSTPPPAPAAPVTAESSNDFFIEDNEETDTQSLVVTSNSENIKRVQSQEQMNSSRPVRLERAHSGSTATTATASERDTVPALPSAGSRRASAKPRSSILRNTVSFLTQRETAAAIPSDIPISCEGYLTKRGHLVTNWKTRYFVLRGNVVQYFVDQESASALSKPVGHVVLSKVAPWSGESHGFMFFTLKQIPYYVYASSEKERSKWMTALASFIVQTEPVDCEGYLTRRGYLVPSFRLRYFVLRGTTLKCFSDQASYHANGTCISELEVKSAGAWSGETNGVMLRSSTDDVTYVCADTTEEQRKWLRALRKLISAPEPISCAGYLTKQGHKRKSWKKRYFILREGGRMTYYSDFDTANTKGKVLGDVAVEDVQKWDGEAFGFMFRTTEQVPYYVYADNERERKKWVTALRKIINGELDGKEPGPTDDSSSNGKVKTTVCPRCTAVLTGTRFCGACGYKHRATFVEDGDSNIKELASAAVANVSGNDSSDIVLSNGEAMMDDEEDEEDTPFDELEALSEGARTLLLAVMQTPEGVEYGGDKSGAFPTRTSNRVNQMSDMEQEIQDALADDKEEEARLLKMKTLEQQKVANEEEELSDMSEEEFDEEEKENEEEKKKINTTAAAKTLADLANESSESDGEVAKEKEAKEVVRRAESTEEEESDEDELDLEGIGGFQPPPVAPATVDDKVDQKEESKSSQKLYSLLEKELEFTPLYVPSTNAPVRCRFYGSMNYQNARRVVVLVSDSGPLGLWRQDATLRKDAELSCDHQWSMLAYINRSLEEGFGVIICNPFANNAKVYEEGGQERVVPIPNSSTPKEHILFVWKNYIQKQTEVAFVAFARGGVLVKYLFAELEQQMREKLHRVCFIDSRHVIDGNESSGVLELLGRRSINWESSTSESIGGQIVSSQPRVGCVCLSMGNVLSSYSNRSVYKNQNSSEPTPQLLEKCIDAAFAFLTAKPEKPGMTAVVMAVRKILRKKSTSKKPTRTRRKSNVVVLGEATSEATSDDANDDSFESSATSNNSKKGYYLPAREKKNVSASTQSSKQQKAINPISVKDFELTKVVGQGGFGKVFLCKKITQPHLNRYYAMKVLKKKHVLSSGLVTTTMAERKILTEIAHPFVVQLYYAFQSDSKLYLVMDYLSGGSLSVHLRRRRKFPEEWARFYAAEIAAAIAHLHSVNIIYRDAKLENVLMDHEGHVRITDFGLSKVGVSGLKGATTFCGTAAYIAPELLKGNAYGKPADWWSFGILLFEMIAGKPPYYHRNRDIMFQTILKQEWLSFPPSFSDSAVSLIRGLLTRDPSKRLGSGPRGADEVLTHPFFNSISWEDLLDKKLRPPFNPGVGELDTSYAPVNLKEITTQDREASIVIPAKPGQKNDFDGFSFVGRPPNLK